MAIKRQNSNPIVIIDGVVANVEPDNRARYVDGSDGKRVPEKNAAGDVVTDYVGRRLAVQTGMPNSDYLEVRVARDFDGVAFGVGEQRLMICEYSEYEFNGRSGSILKWLADVTAAQAEGWAKNAKASQPA